MRTRWSLERRIASYQIMTLSPGTVFSVARAVRDTTRATTPIPDFSRLIDVLTAFREHLRSEANLIEAPRSAES